jgi:EmrB/QacA subfamily drug resistance transporter
METQDVKRPPLGLLCSAQFMLVLDFAIVNVALPSMQRHLGFTDATLPWVVGAYALFFGGFLLIGGRAGDLFGRKRMFIAGMAIFTVASLVGGFATAPIVLIAARALQGLAAAAASPAVLAIIAGGYTEGRDRAKAMGVFGAVASAGFTGGVLAGGILTEYLGWRSVMFVNVPFGILLTVLAAKRVVADHGVAAGKRIDIPGALLITTSMCLISYALTVAANDGWGSRTVLWTLGGGAALLVVFAILQTRLAAPLVPPSIFRIRSVTAGDTIAFLSGGVMSISTFFLTLYMQQELGYSAIRTGLAFFPQAFIVVLASKFVAQYTGRFGAKPVLLVGAVLLVGGSAALTQVTAHGSFLVHILPGGLLLGVGVAVMMISTAVAATTGVPGAQMGLASGLYNSARQLGVGLCLALAVTIANVGHGAFPTIGGYQKAFELSALLSVLITLTAAILPSRKPAVAPAPVKVAVGASATPVGTAGN